MEKIKLKPCQFCGRKAQTFCTTEREYCAAYQLLHNLIPNARTLGSDEIEKLREKLRLANLTNRRIVANYPPITHGHWVMMLDSYTQRAPKHGWFCSECREIIIKKDRKRLPKYCEECGTKMKIEKPLFVTQYEEILLGTNAGWCTQATCDECGAASPFVSGMETEKDAYEVAREKAMRRWQEPNRVLTLDEVFVIACNDYNTEQETAMYLECREDNEGYAIVTDVETDGSKILLEFSGVGGGCKLNEKDYGSLWRCWLQKPTKAELDAEREDEDE